MTAYERARADPAFLERFAAGYTGTKDPLDALWWQDHPDEQGPSGAPSPAAALAELRRAVYAPGSDPSDTERYRRSQRAFEREREAVRVALRAAEALRSPAPATAAGTSGTGEGAATPGAPLRRRPLLLVVAGAAVAAFAAGLLVAPALGRPGAAQPGAAATPSATAPFISGGSGTGTALGVFGEPQRDIDRPPIAVDARLVPESFRRLEAVPLRGVDIYAAQDSRGGACLVALSVDARVAASCMPIAGWRQAPIRLLVRADAYLDETRRVSDQVELLATWTYLGRFSLEEEPVKK